MVAALQPRYHRFGHPQAPRRLALRFADRGAQREQLLRAAACELRILVAARAAASGAGVRQHRVLRNFAKSLCVAITRHFKRPATALRFWRRGSGTPEPASATCGYPTSPRKTCPTSSDEPPFDRRGLDRLLQLLKGAHLDLPHALARDAVLLRQVFEGRRIVAQAAL